MRAPYAVRQDWKAAKRLRKAKDQLEKAFWKNDQGYGFGHRFPETRFDTVNKKVSEIMGVLETEARILEGKCS
jgi:hypothetical protein